MGVLFVVPFYFSRIFPSILARDSFSVSSFVFSRSSFFRSAMSRQQLTFSFSWSSEMSICFFRSSARSRVNSESSSPFGAFSKRKLWMFAFMFSPSLMNLLLRTSLCFIISLTSITRSFRESSFALPTESMFPWVFQVFSCWYFRGIPFSVGFSMVLFEEKGFINVLVVVSCGG